MRNQFIYTHNEGEVALSATSSHPLDSRNAEAELGRTEKGVAQNNNCEIQRILLVKSEEFRHFVGACSVRVSPVLLAFHVCLTTVSERLFRGLTSSPM